ncbi:MAG: YbjN domain-containing protein [Actinomycetota bacterium]|nr:YbjN domain-containing protein [Actinomycetota bacterium]
MRGGEVSDGEVSDGGERVVVMATEIEWLGAWVEKCMRTVFDGDDVTIDQDGDVMFRSGTAACWVSVQESDPTMVIVFAHAALGVKPTAALLREVNDLNQRALSGTITIVSGTIMVRQAMLASTVTVESLDQACHQVSRIANDIGHLAAVMFDGHTPYAPEPVDHEA